MGLLLAPYNNAMRIGQGFNSYTQQICIDDAVAKNPSRQANQVTNDGWTMKEIAESMKNQHQELQIENLAQSALDAEFQKTLDEYNARHPLVPAKDAKTETGTDGVAVAPVDTPADDAEVDIPKDETEEARSERLKIKAEKEKEQNKKAGKALAAKAATLGPELKSGLSNRSAASLLDLRPTKQFAFVQSGRRGPSQIVTYTSRFVNKVSDITDDMNISGSLSIKYNMIGGSGRGSFLDSEKIMNADLNFYISVKVINQTINDVDHLEFKPIKNTLEGDAFRTVYGDSFVSGFIEGGEFNAVVSMKILNKEKKTNIAASAKVALTVGPASVEAQGSVNIAKENLEANTETTYQVSWSGGGHLKNSQAPWTLDTLAEVASRFADLVAVTPQRTYAILTKYESLRSFQEQKPATLSPLFYENAALYTNEMLDAYMEYKAMYKRISEEIFEIEGNTLQFGLPKGTLMTTPPNTTTIERLTYKGEDPSNTSDSGKTMAKLGPLNPIRIDDLTPFPASIPGLDMARRNIRHQMSKIVTEVDRITLKPELATSEAESEKFQSPTMFRTRLPTTKPVQKTPSAPLAIGKISTEATDMDDESKPHELYVGSIPLDHNSKPLYDRIVQEMPAAGNLLRMGSLIGSSPTPGPTEPSTAFNDLIFVKPDFLIQRIEVQVSKGSLSGLSILYANGLIVSHGNITRDEQGRKTIKSVTLGLHRGEKIISCSVEAGRKEITDASQKEPTYQFNSQITALKLFTNRGQSLTAQGIAGINDKGEVTRDGVRYKDLQPVDIDPLIENGHLKAFGGFSSVSTNDDVAGVIAGLSLVWGTHFDYKGPVIIIPAPPVPEVSRSTAEQPKSAPVEQPKTLTLKGGWSLTKIPDNGALSVGGASAIASGTRATNHVEMWWITDSGTVQGAYCYDKQSWVRYDLTSSGASAAPGSIAAVCQDPNTSHVMWITPKGAVSIAGNTQNSGWLCIPLTSDNTAKPGAGITLLSRKSGTMEACWISPTGSVEAAYWYTGSQWKLFQMAPAGTAAAKSSLASLCLFSVIQIVWWIGPDGSIRQARFVDGKGDGWVYSVIAGAGTAATESRLTVVNRTVDVIDLFYISPAGSIVGLTPVGSAQDSALSKWASYQVAGDNSAKADSGLKATSINASRIDVMWVGVDGSIQGCGWNGNWARYEIGEAGMAAVGTPIGAVCRRENLLEMWFKTTSKTVVQGSWTN